MSIAIVTWVTYNNYGTQLQAFALQQYITKEFEYCETISDRIIIESKSKPKKDNYITYDNETGLNHVKGLLSRYLFHPLAIVTRINKKIENKKIEQNKSYYYESQKCFDRFKAQKLRIRNVQQVEEYKSLNDEFDIFICGSDQIWSMLKQNYNGFFFLDFVSKKKISYATSIGSYLIEENNQDLYKKLLSDYFAISVREKYTAEQLSKLLQREVSWVLDPTLLFDSVFWAKQAKGDIPKKPYLLCYFLEDKDWYFEYAYALSREHKLKVVLVPNKISFAKRKGYFANAVGPEEFVGLFQSAAFVLTDSYHGSIFSIIFNKPFLCFKRFQDAVQHNQNIRIDSLFQALEIYDEVVINQKQYESKDITELDYSDINNKLLLLRKKSKTFLNFSIRGEYDNY